MKQRTLNITERASGSLFFLSFDNLSLKAGDSLLLESVSLSFKYDRIVLIKGAVGTGKSSLLKLLAGLRSASSGAFFHTRSDGRPLKPVFLHSQPEFNFITGYVRDELSFAGVSFDNFTSILSKSVHDLSGGELKKLSLLMALERSEDSVLMVDEPLDMLDDPESELVASLIVKASSKTPFIIATHDSHFDSCADVVVTITDGE